MTTQQEKRLKLWKARQAAEGHDVSGVMTLEQAEHFFDKKECAAVDDAVQDEVIEEIGEIEEIEDVTVPEEPAAPAEPKKPKNTKGKKSKEV